MFQELTAKEKKMLKKLGATSNVVTVSQPILLPNEPDPIPTNLPEDVKPDLHDKESTSAPYKDVPKNTGLGNAKYIDESLRASFQVPSQASLSGFQSIDFQDPADLIYFYDKELNTGSITLYPWQLEVLAGFGKAQCDKMHAHKFALCAANGSGKDAFIVAPFAVWLAFCKIQARVIITSASGNQLSTQTETYIRNLCQSINEYHNEEIFRIRQRYIYCRLTGSEIRLFATDEEGKAEGYHPITPNATMAIIVNEGKSIEPKIYRALRRCTGYSYWLDVSSPGAPHGDFYAHFNRWNARRVDYTECPHSNEEERLEDIIDLGEHNSLYRSKWLALFTTVEGTSIIPQDAIDRNVEMSKDGRIKRLHNDWLPRVGIDIAAGGDETSVRIVIGNAIKARLDFREKDTTITAARIDAFLRENNIPKDSELIFGDDGGVGHAVLDVLSSEPYGWKVARVNNQSPSNNKKMFINRGAQNWFRIKRLFESNLLFFSFDENEKDKKMLDQLASRFYKQQNTQGRIALESKAEAKANGRPSPDRADAYVLAFTGLSVSDFLEDKLEHTGKEDLSPLDKLKRNGTRLTTVEQVEAWHQEDRYKKYQELGQKVEGKSINGSVRNLIKQRMGSNNVRYN